MAVDLVMTGHGGWDPKAGSIRVPEGTTIKFYADVMKALLNDNGRLVDSFDSVLKQIEPTTYEAGDSCWDFEISAPVGLDIYRQADDPDASTDYEQYIADGNYKLSTLLKQPQFQNRTLHWAACVVVELKETGGGYIGVNAGQTDIAEGEYSPDSASGGSAYFDGDPQDLVAMVAVAFPGYTPDKRTYDAIIGLAAAAEQGASQLVAYYRALPDPDRNGLQLNDTLRWWLKDLGLPDGADRSDDDGPEVVELRWDQIDWTFVTGVNKQSVKDLGEGDSLPFWQAREGLLIGNYFPENYRRIFEEAAGATEADGNQPHGQLTMEEKGGTFSSGKLSVTGYYEQDSFKASIREFSDKKITFN